LDSKCRCPSILPGLPTRQTESDVVKGTRSWSRLSAPKLRLAVCIPDSIIGFVSAFFREGAVHHSHLPNLGDYAQNLCPTIGVSGNVNDGSLGLQLNRFSSFQVTNKPSTALYLTAPGWYACHQDEHQGYHLRSLRGSRHGEVRRGKSPYDRQTHGLISAPPRRLSYTGR
jgi:hypothetical protein